MTNRRTYVRLLRHLGVALLFAPEPFTTPFGVAFVLVARHLSKRHEASVNNRLRETVQYYLARSSLLGHDADSKSGGPGRIKPHGLSEEPPILGQITGSRSVQARSSVRQGRRDIQEGRASHTTGIEWPFGRCETANSTASHSSWAATSGGAGEVTRHSVNMGLLSGHYGTGNIGQAKSLATNITRRRQGHGAAATHKTVHRALLDNNHYYDMLSRGNVIGGY